MEDKEKNTATPPAPKPPHTTLLTEEQGQKLLVALKERKAEANCARCGNDNFQLVPGIAYLPVQAPQAPPVLIGGSRIPAAVVNCARCGAIYLHGLGTLGFMDPDGKITL